MAEGTGGERWKVKPRRTLLNTIVVHRIRFTEGTCFRLIVKVIVVKANVVVVVIGYGDVFLAVATGADYSAATK